MTLTSSETLLPNYILSPDQIKLFTHEGLKTKKISTFDPASAAFLLETHQKLIVRAIDIGGSNITTRSYIVDQGIHPQNDVQRIENQNGGAGYLEFLEQVASTSQLDGLPIGISTTGLIEGTSFVDSNSLPYFTSEFKKKHNGNFAHLFQNLRNVVNDGVAGLVAGSIIARYRFPESQRYVFIINGTGIGAAVIQGGFIWSTEPGHIKVVDQLNPHGQHERCGGRCNTEGACIKKVAASKSGIENIWFQKTGEKLSGQQISLRFQQGDKLAQELYENSALLIAHIVFGLAKAFGFDEDLANTPIIFHGGCFKVPEYDKKVKSFLEGATNKKVNTINTNDFSENVSLDGAAISTLLTQ